MRVWKFKLSIKHLSDMMGENDDTARYRHKIERYQKKEEDLIGIEKKKSFQVWLRTCFQIKQSKGGNLKYVSCCLSFCFFLS